MNISFIALNISGAESVQSAADKLRGVLSAHGRCDFRLCGSMSQVSSSLGDAFANSELIVVGLEPSAYCKSKLAILRAMHIKTQLSEEIKALAGENADMTAYQLSMHCAMPVSAELFPTEDGLYSGFAIKSGKQHFALITLDKLRLEAIVNNGFKPLLNRIAPPEEKKNEIQPDADFAANAGKALRSCGKRVYFADTPSIEMVKSLCAEEIENGTMVFSGYTAKRGDEPPRSYIADLARYAIPEDEDALGAAVSNVFTGTSQESGEQKYNVYVAVADVTASRVLRFASQPGETPEELITSAIEMLMEMICDKCVQLSEEAEPTAVFTAEPIEEELEEPTPAEKTKKKHRGLRMLAYTVLAIILAVVVYFSAVGFKNADENRDRAVSAFASLTIGAAVDSGSDSYYEENFTDLGSFVEFEEETQETTAEPETTAPETTTLKATETTVNIESTALTTTTKTETTTARTTVTAKVTTTKAVTTTAKPTTTAASADTAQVSGSFVFTVYGYGHGVGMSQEGALAFAKQGMSYDKILTHYYPGTTVEKSDSAMPEAIVFGGTEYSVLEYLCRSVAAEIGTSAGSSSREAYKAQAVAIYTYAKRYSFNISSSQHAFNKTFAYEGSQLEAAIKEILGVWLSYDGRPAMTTYFAMSAGKTTKASTVWSGSTYPYLETAVDSSPDKNCSRYKTTYTISAEDFKSLMQKNLGVELSGDPSGWVKILEHDSAVSSSIGYVTKMRVGTKTISGAAFRATAMAYKIRSHCFTVEYQK